MNDTDLKEFLSVVTNEGKINARRLRREYFQNIGKVELFDAFLEATEHSEKGLRDKVNLALIGYLTEYPKCKICGKECTMNGRSLSLYCSKECAFKDSDRANKIRETKQKKDHTATNEKRKQTMLAKYGVAYNSQRKDIHDIWEKTKLSHDVYEKLSNREWLYEEYIVKGKPAVMIAKEIGCDFSTVLNYCRMHGFPIKQHYNQSLIEGEVKEWLETLGVTVVQGYRGGYTNNREIDLFIPSKNVGIEINGLYWHTEQFHEKRYHQNKTLEVKAGIRLIQITDKQWKERKEICKSIIRNALGMSVRIGARQCTIETYKHTTPEITRFFNDSHMEGFVGGSSYLMLRHKGEIVSGMIIGRSRFHREKLAELLRYVCKINTQVQGAFNRLIKEYRKNNNERLFSYVNLSLFNASLYRINPHWKLIGYTESGYLWTNGNETVSRYKAMKKRMKEWLPSYDESLSESENMKNNGFYRYYDSGNAIYEYIE